MVNIRHAPLFASDTCASYCLLEVYNHYDLSGYVKIIHHVRSAAIGNAS